jgi:hypothetical protein
MLWLAERAPEGWRTPQDLRVFVAGVYRKKPGLAARLL